MSDPDVLRRLRAQIDAVGHGSTRPTEQASAARDDTDTAADPRVAKALAFLARSTARRPLTVAEARDKLASRDHDQATIERAVTTATAQKVLDDAGFADAWVADRGVKRGYGRRRLRRELSKRKVPEAIIDAALTQLDEVDERGQALDLARQRAQRMPATLDPAKVANRLVGMLVRRGYDSGLAHEVAREATALDHGWD